MEWLEKLNEALQYIEGNLDGEIKYEKAANIACCTTYHFQRMFSYIAGTPLSEYIRNRRLTKAALDLQNGEKVIDVAIRYGYESPTAFNRAFQKIHNVSPSVAQKEGTFLKAYPPISFKITIKGVEEMEYRIVKKEEMRIVGAKALLEKNVEENFNTVPMLWQEVAQSGKIMEIASLMGPDSKGVLGVSACMDYLDKWEYYIAVETDKEAPKGLEEYTIPACTWAVFPGEGQMPTAIQDIEKRAITEWLPTSGYEYADAPDIELYLNQDPMNSKFEVWIPIRKNL
ncbi:AraC family transcriptional regulator [[Clostridium] sordellii]|uniref:Transcriptional regulator, AraC family n=1 Tax=Paraclostridium sordellii TaxID=1505 RepID=A0ABM9RM85_PARSO|nr:AraC family transcriptional regulator [Paeniclostridium sordellii]MDU6482958.1 AraC family transcriptional regulator [Paeniclostridium sordellii]MRZ79930.1 helix-turn-helix domain-containing protein [Paeniclostridium sordellii]MSB59546.1 helix-turn-helix domain-containing protein [Paeniclostridium sordellii]CEJ73145.1 Transcriptional regulator, AraC family [[Clostridium] sordellii] [Paeniclostridium sordellii]CEN68698.1 AraC family transcriptional regulator [[Clostridium] sordellii] [Paenic